MLERKPNVTDADWHRYFCAIDAITSRNPARVKPNCIEMLTAKCWQVQDEELREDAFSELRKLNDKVCHYRGRR